MSEDDMREPEASREQRDEEMRRNMEFIVRQQAQFTADMQRSRDEEKERWKKEDERQARTQEGIRELLKKVQEREKNRKENSGADAGA